MTPGVIFIYSARLLTEDLTRTSGDAPAPLTPPRGGRFVSGTVLAGRYRIVTLLGAGGMGEVYKADDLKLDHPVALKFLPETLSLSPAALARFHNEVRVSRQVSHPNVCRVHDIGDVDGLQFLTMEFIDGDDLASLLRRIGRLPPAKAIEVARQLCAGLAAAHDAGVLHRDLKPHNVMIDGRGRARITDFGVAALARDVRHDSMVAGTPAYMAPEQLRGAEATVRSDIYSLGLILYEIFTGQRAVQVNSLADAVLHHSSATPIVPPSSVVAGIDPAVERVIARCLEKDPASRPASAIQVSAALPGGDPLQAALAAGETPSPEMVAASGSSDAMRPAIAIGIAATAVALVAMVGFSGARGSIASRVTAEAPPAALAFRARETLTALGYADRGADHASGFVRDLSYLQWDLDHRPTGERAERLARTRPTAFQFWYRESPAPLGVFLGLEFGPPRYPVVTLDNPPPVVPGMRYLKTDAKGRLIEFGAVPRDADAPAARASMNWDDVFHAAGLERSAFTSVPSEWTPATAMDERASWTGAYPEQPDLPIRIDAASYRGRLVAFRTTGTWSDTDAPPGGLGGGAAVAAWILTTISLTLAVINLRAGRGDRRGAIRIAGVVFGLMVGGWALGAHHVWAAEELDQLRQMVSLALFNGALMYINYLALEPHVRRRWPAVLVAWVRAVAGRWRDPLVGREVLLGVAAGALVNLAIYLAMIGHSLTMDSDPALSLSAAMPRAAGAVLYIVGGAISTSLFMTVFFLVMRVVTRSTIIAGAIVVVGGALTVSGPSTFGMFVGATITLAGVLSLTRLGLLGFVGMMVAAELAQLVRGVIAQDTGTGIFVIAIFALIVGAAAWVAIGRPAIKRATP